MIKGEGLKPLTLVVDAMDLNHFTRVDRLDVLHDLLVADRCYTTYVVLDEVRQGVLVHPELNAVIELEWLAVVPLESVDELNCFTRWAERIGAGSRNLGEASVFAAAEICGGTAITDDQAATRVARRFGLDVHGTVWLLGRACRDGKLTITAAGNLIDMLRTTGMRLPCTGTEFEHWARHRALL